MYVQCLFQIILYAKNHKIKGFAYWTWSTKETRGLKMILNMTWTYHQQLSRRTSQTCLQFLGWQVTLPIIDLRALWSCFLGREFKWFQAVENYQQSNSSSKPPAVEKYWHSIESLRLFCFNKHCHLNSNVLLAPHIGGSKQI